MNTIQLESFKAVANYLNFSKAAERMCLTQPAISHQINMLEDELGTKLFHRTSKTVRLTDEGAQFLHYAEEILRLAGVSKARLKAIGERNSKRIVVGVRNSIELRLLGPVLKWYAENGMDIVPVIRMMPFASLENMLADGDLDMIFSFSRSDDGGLRFRTLCRPRICLMCSGTDPLGRNGMVSVKAIGRMGKMALCRPPYCPDELFRFQGGVVGERTPEEIFFCDNLEVVEEMCAAGYAFALAVDFPSARRTGLAYVELEDAPSLQFGVLLRKNAKNPVLEGFIAKLEDCLGNC